LITSFYLKTTTLVTIHVAIKAIMLALECKAEGECSENEQLCDETRIRELFKETRSKLEKEFLIRTRMG